MAVMKIIVGVDDSDMAEFAVKRALDLGGRLGAEVDVVNVSHVPSTVLAAMAGVPTVAEDFAHAQREGVWARIGPLLEGTTASRVDLEGYPPDALIDHAKATSADLIVVGSRGRGDLASLLLGSTSHRVVNNAPCDVLVVRGEG
jgi:nucleotide-binding universal stress UspA family protein